MIEYISINQMEDEDDGYRYQTKSNPETAIRRRRRLRRHEWCLPVVGSNPLLAE